MTHLMWRMDEADWSMKQLGSRMNQAEYEATKEGGRYHEACAQYHFLCKEVNGIKGENSTMAAHLQLIDRMNKNTQKQHLNKIEFLEQRIKEQDERIKQLEQIIKKGGMQCDAAADEQCDAAGAAADDVSMSDAPAPPDQYQDEAAGAHDQIKSKMKQLEHMIKPGPSVDVSMGSTGSSI